jgi:uncharacterized protein
MTSPPPPGDPAVGATGPVADGETMVLRPPRHRVEHRAIWWWALAGTAWSLPPLVAAWVAFVVWPDARPWLVVVAALVTVLAVVGVVVEPVWRYAVHRWEVTPDAVYGLSGWWVREWRVAPISRIQTVDAVRGPLEQLMGLSTLRVTTASSRGSIDIVGLDRDVAEQAARQLSEITQQTPGDAT